MIIIKKQNERKNYQSPSSKRKISVLSNSNGKNNNPKNNNSNIGDKLYKEFLEKEKENIEKKKQLILEDKLKNEKLLTFHPKINENSEKIINTLFKNKKEREINSFDKKLKEIKQKEEEENLFKPQLTKLTNYLSFIKRKNREEKLYDEYIEINPEYLVQKRSLTPKNSMKNFNKESKNNKSDILNKTDDNIINYKTIYRPSHYIKKEINGKKIPIPQIDPVNNLHDYLYIEARMLKDKKEIERKKLMALECPFTPTISKSNDKYIKNENRKNIFKRLFYEKKSKISSRISTGNNIRKITINNKENSTNKNSLNKNIKKSRSPQGRLKTNIILEDNNPFEVCNKQKKIIDNKKYKDLFYILDNDKDGLISSSKIHLCVLTNEELKQYTKILGYIQEKGCPIDIHEFCMVMNIYYGN